MEFPGIPELLLSDDSIDWLETTLREEGTLLDITKQRSESYAHCMLHKRYWSERETLPQTLNEVLDVMDVDPFKDSNGKLIIFKEYWLMLKIIKARFDEQRPGVIITGNPGTGQWLSDS